MRAFASTSAVAALPLRVARCRGSARITSLSARSRDLHTLPPYPFPVENGLPNFLSPKALNTIAVEYQGGLLARLNDEVKGGLCLVRFYVSCLAQPLLFEFEFIL